MEEGTEVSTFNERLARSMEHHKNILDRLAGMDIRPEEHGRLTTGRLDDGKVDMCRCGEMADLCAALREAEEHLR